MIYLVYQASVVCQVFLHCDPPSAGIDSKQVRGQTVTNNVIGHGALQGEKAGHILC